MNFACALDVTLDQDKANQCAMFILATMAKPSSQTGDGGGKAGFYLPKPDNVYTNSR